MTSAVPNIISGTPEDDTLLGTLNADIFELSEGADDMAGGLGDDTYYVDNVGDAVHEIIRGGRDTVISSIDYQLGAYVENLTLTGSAINGTGNTLANVIIGNDMDNILKGGARDDTIDGGAGVNIALYENSLQNYIVSQTEEGFTVEDGGDGYEGLDVLKNIQYVRFYYQTFALSNLVGNGTRAPVSLGFDAAPPVSRTSDVETVMGSVKALGFANGAHLTYSIVNGADADYFSISDTGELLLAQPLNPDWDVYYVTVQVNDGLQIVKTKALTIHVADPPAPEPPEAPPLVFTSDDTSSVSDGYSTEQSAFTASASVVNYWEYDLFGDQGITYSIVGGADQDLFTIDSVSGQVMFRIPPSYAAPADSGGDNVYDIVVQAERQGATTTQAVQIRIIEPQDTHSTIAADTGNPYIDGLLQGSKWGVVDPDDSHLTKVTYSFPTLKTDYDQVPGAVDQELQNFSPISDTLKNAIVKALKWYGSIANINFVEIDAAGDGAPTQKADLRFGYTNGTTLENNLGKGYFPNDIDHSGNVWFRSGSDSSYLAMGTKYYSAIFHEIAHALGLSHPFQLSGTDVVANPQTDTPVDHWFNAYTIMLPGSFMGVLADNGNQQIGYQPGNNAQTPMMDDIRALQTLYGANYTSHAGNTVYKWDPATGEESISEDGGAFIKQGASTQNVILMTVWDGNGDDTYDFSNYSENMIISLQPGGWSILSTQQLEHSITMPSVTAPGNVFNAYLYDDDPRSLIENAIGGSGDDGITGNQADNHLVGGAGNDQLLGLEGNDTLDGGVGDQDIAIYRGARADYVITKTADNAYTIRDLVAGRDGTDSVSNLEFLRFSDKSYAITDVEPHTSHAQSDFDGDGKSDILLQNGADGMCFVWGMDGLNLKQDGFGVVGWTPPSTTWHAVGTGDFNGDGKSDILLQNGDDGMCFTWEMDGLNLKDSGAVGWTPPSDANNHWVVKGAGDFDGDGKSDVLLQNSVDGMCFTWEMDGLNVKASGVVGWTPPSNQWHAVGTGDFDGDGKSDILLQNGDDGMCFVWEMDGLSVKASGVVGWTPPSNKWHAVGTGDFDGDGKSDILLQNADDGMCFVWEMNGLIVKDSGPVGWTPPSDANNHWVVVGTGDFDGDGKSDILLQNSADGMCFTWEMDGLNVKTSGVVGWTPQSVDWHAMA